MRVFRHLAMAALGLLCVGLGNADAAEPDYAGMLLGNQSLLASTPKGCDDKTVSLNNVELQQCAAAAFLKADRVLNAAYAAALKDGNSDRNDRLRQAQRHWLAFRNLECDWQSLQYEGGTLAPVAMGHCLVEVTQDRVRQLTQGVEP